VVEPASVPVAAEPVARPVGNPVVAAVAAWLIPGLGHLYLRRWLRGAAFFVLVIASLWIGCELQGKLFRPVPNEPLSKLGTLGALGTGVPYFFLRYGQHYEGDVVGAGFEYGTAFLITAGLMNWLLILDVWDISRGKKE
jgi:drug/metabolite transporter (DMT)-like permease